MSNYDPNIRAKLRARATEVIGDVYLPSISTYAVRPYEEDPTNTNKALIDPTTGRASRLRLPEYRANEFRDTAEWDELRRLKREDNENYRWPMYDGKAVPSSAVNDDVNQKPVNLNNLNIPTSTSNPSRPRTLAAGYYLYVGERAKKYPDQRGKLTVMFRDGTFWNYYDVPPGTWQEFKSAISKGPMLNRYKNGSDGILLNFPNGPADVTEVPEELQRYVYRVARATQLGSTTKYARNIKVGDKIVRTKYVPTSAQKMVRYSKGEVSKNNKLGKNPNQK